MANWDCFVAFLDRWQTLVTGLIALGAAILALRPVYTQLALMRKQNKFMVRDTIGDMILQLDANKKDTMEILSTRLSKFHTDLNYYEYHERDYKFDDWCGEQESELRYADFELRSLFLKSYHVEEIEDCKLELQDSLNSLINLLWEIDAPTKFERFPEDFSWTEAEASQRYARSIKARDEVEEYADRVSSSTRKLYDAFLNQRLMLVKRLREIDDTLLT